MAGIARRHFLGSGRLAMFKIFSGLFWLAVIGAIFLLGLIGIAIVLLGYFLAGIIDWLLSPLFDDGFYRGHE